MSSYPLDAESQRDVRLQDFEDFFAPGGTIDRYFQDYLKDFVDASQTPWRWVGPGGSGQAISDEALAQFQRAAAIERAFFSSDGQLLVRFELKPVGLDGDEVSRFFLDLGGQQITYSHGPIKTIPLRWPGPERYEVRIRFDPLLSGPSGLTEDGPWAWFRMLEQAALSPTDDPERFTLAFQVGDRRARYELLAGSAFNPFGLEELKAFSCPQRL